MLQGPITSLAEVAIGARLRVLNFTQESPYVAHLQRLGVVVGTELQVIRRAPLGDPIEVRLRGYSLALRPQEAQALAVQVIE